MNELILYTRAECHLCDQAEAVARDAAERVTFALVKRDIDGDVPLLQRYATRIPVLARADDGAELNWPFDADQVAELAAGPAG